MNDQTILVVDDEPLIRQQLAEALTSAGYAVRTAGNAQEALHLMHRKPADLLFLDLMLPGMNGVELCREVRRHWPWSIAIAVTGYASVFQLVDCREAGFEDYFVKPMRLADLRAAAATAFKKIARWRRRNISTGAVDDASQDPAEAVQPAPSAV